MFRAYAEEFKNGGSVKRGGRRIRKPDNMPKRNKKNKIRGWNDRSRCKSLSQKESR
jgi:hypothetical protein